MSSIKPEVNALAPLYPSARQLCQRYGLEPKKNWGQNFLDRGPSIQKMLSPFALTEHSTVLELGPGLGHLSRAILATGARLIAVEIDKSLAEPLQALGRVYPRFQVIFSPAQDLNWQELLSDQTGDLFVFGNLPYYLSTELYSKALLEVWEAKGMSFLLQREVAERFAHAPGSKLYGPLSALGQCYGKVSLGERLKPSAFYPPPSIESRVLRLEKHQETLLDHAQLPNFWSFLQTCFQARRKTLNNNLSGSVWDRALTPGYLSSVMKDAKIDPTARAEELSAVQFVRLFEAFEADMNTQIEALR